MDHGVQALQTDNEFIFFLLFTADWLLMLSDIYYYSKQTHRSMEASFRLISRSYEEQDHQAFLRG